MGQSNGVFSKDELEEYTELTYLSRGEVLQAFSKFSGIDPDKVGQNRHAKISCERVRNSTEELKLNPFGDRICSVFSSCQDEAMSFDDYLDMYSALSEQATRDVKTAYAFRIYDFDGDGVIGREDIKMVVDRLLYDDDKHLTRAETTGVIDNLLKEVDNDEDGAICFPEFQQAMQKCPDFMCNFKMYLS